MGASGSGKTPSPRWKKHFKRQFTFQAGPAVSSHETQPSLGFGATQSQCKTVYDAMSELLFLLCYRPVYKCHSVRYVVPCTQFFRVIFQVRADRHSWPSGY